MDVSDVLSLSGWYSAYSSGFIEKYETVFRVLEHNANQPSKQPVREPLENLIAALLNVPLAELTNEELDKLDELNILKYLGQRGVDLVSKTIASANYDPASAVLDIQKALEILREHQQYFEDMHQALIQLDFLEYTKDERDHQTFVRVRFKEDASIGDVHDLKKWGLDWHDIARGAAMCVGETPQSVRVVGASNGSVIITLGTIASISMVLAVIAKNAGRIAREILELKSIVEDLRHKKHLNKIIEDELKRQQEEIHKGGIDDTVQEVSAIPANGITQEIDAILRKAIQKYFKFYEQGGDVDFIVNDPEIANLDDEDADDQATMEAEIALQVEENKKLNDMIKSIRDQKHQIERLTGDLEGFEKED